MNEEEVDVLSWVSPSLAVRTISVDVKSDTELNSTEPLTSWDLSGYRRGLFGDSSALSPFNQPASRHRPTHSEAGP